MNNLTTAWMNLAGILLITLGTLYWAYEILGGRQGPLGLITRAVTYSLFYTLGYGILLGFYFGAVTGIGLGLLLAVEYHRVARHQRLYHSSPLFNIPLFGVARGMVFGLASVKTFGWKFAVAFGSLAAIGLSIVYYFRFSPTHDYRSDYKPKIHKRQVQGSLWRGLIAMICALVASPLAAHLHFLFALRLGGTVGLFSMLIGIVAPMVEWQIDNLPENLVAATGVVLVLIGGLCTAIPPLSIVLAASSK